MLSKYLLIPLATLEVIFLALSVKTYGGYGFQAAGVAVLTAIVYVLSPQIDWWYYERNPPEMDKTLEQFLRRYFPYYRNLSPVHQPRFRNRVCMYLIATEFLPKAMETVPEDIKGLIAANAVQMSLGLEKYRFSDFESIVVYPHPFPSPQYQKHFHSSEIFREDGVILWSLEQLLPGITQPDKYYNIVLHEYAKIFVLMNPSIKFPKLDAPTWPILEQISGLKMETVRNFIGLPALDALPMSINYFFTYPERFEQLLPEVFEYYKKVFNQDPTRKDIPVIDGRKQGKGI